METMKITIPKRMSGTGNIYSLSSDMYDRTILFNDRYEYAVVSPAYYSGYKITRHQTISAALREYKKRDLPGTRIIRDTQEMVTPDIWATKEGYIRSSDWEPIPEEWEVTRPTPPKYRFEHGALFEYRPDMQAYLHVGKGRNRSQAIKAYEASL